LRYKGEDLMLKNRIQPKWVAFLVVIFAASSVFAQGDDKTGDDKAGSKAGGKSKKGADAEVKFRKASQLTAAEQLAQANKYVARMRQTLARIAKLAGQARKDRDLIKLNCVTDKKNPRERQFEAGRVARGELEDGGLEK
jgi:hypothetical protein